MQLLYFKVAENKGIALHRSGRGSLWLYADEGELRQVLINLINNAVKAMPDGGSLEIRAEKEPEGVSLTVTDTGVGMDARKIGAGAAGDRDRRTRPVHRAAAAGRKRRAALYGEPRGAGTRARITFPGKGGEA